MHVKGVRVRTRVTGTWGKITKKKKLRLKIAPGTRALVQTMDDFKRTRGRLILKGCLTVI